MDYLDKNTLWPLNLITILKSVCHSYRQINLQKSEIPLLLGGRRRSARLKHVLKHPVLDAGDGLVLDGREVKQPAEVRDMAGQGVPPQVGAVLPLGGIRVARPRVSLVAVLDLRVIGKPLVHPLL
jgi:hypothetical protein